MKYFIVFSFSIDELELDKTDRPNENEQNKGKMNYITKKLTYQSAGFHLQCANNIKLCHSKTMLSFSETTTTATTNTTVDPGNEKEQFLFFSRFIGLILFYGNIL